MSNGRLIKNYTTEIPAEKTLGEIQALLAKNGARGIAMDYDENGIVKDVFFKIIVNGQEMPFRLPAKADKVYDTLFANMIGKRTHEESRRHKAANIAWRICKTWLEAQITLINLDQAKMEEIFLPYLVMPDKKTLFEKMKDNQFLLPSGS